MTGSGDWGEFDDALQDDIEKYRRYQRRGTREFTPPAIIELVLFTAAAVVAVAWFGAMFLVPDHLEGTTWMALGILGMLLTGAPGVLIYWLRRGGADEIQQTLRAFTG